MNSQHSATTPLTANCMLRRSTPQIISRPVTSLTAVELHIQIHKSNFHLVFHKLDIFVWADGMSLRGHSKCLGSGKFIFH